MFKKTCLIIFFSFLMVGNVVFASPKFDITYNDFVEVREKGKEAVFAGSIVGKSFDNRFQCLMSSSKKNDDKFALRITDLPSSSEGDTFLDLKFYYKNSRTPLYNFKIKDSNGENCMIGTINKSGEGRLEHVSGGEDKKVSGNIIMNIWDSLCYLLAPKRIEIDDCSNVGAAIPCWMELRILRPYTHSDHRSWYGSFGYEPVRNKEEYYDAIFFLVNRTIGDVYDDFEENEEIRDLLEKYHNELHDKKLGISCFLSRCTRTISDLAQFLYKKRLERKKIEEDDDLGVLYYHCLANYNFFNINDKDGRIKKVSKKQKRLWLTRLFEKTYDIE